VIYPTRAAVLAAACTAPLALLVGVFLPERWYAGLAGPLAVVVLTMVDALVGVGRAASARVELPPSMWVGATIDATVQVAAPARLVEIALSGDRLLTLEDEGRLRLPLAGGKGAALLPVTAIRRGTARIERVWLRWPGALGLAWHQRQVAVGATVAILPDLSLVQQRGAQLFKRHALQGLIAQLERGDGSDFESLAEYRSGMDRRAIDWKQSARHLKLHAKNYQSEHNNQLVFAIDGGRQMSEPVAGMPRVDRAVSAMLLTAWVGLKLGDRVALHAFDSRPRIASGMISGVGAFGELQRLAARIDYSSEETNYTFALTTLATRLVRRSMIVLFTEFVDTISADFLVRAARRLVEKHLLLIVVLRDEELESIVERPPVTADDVTRAVTAAALLRDRLLVLTRLRHLGAHVVESEYDRVGERLVAGYVDLKRRNLL